MVAGAGIEPALPYGKEILSLSCLPIPPPGQGAIYSVGLRRSIREDRRKNGGASRSRTGLAGFAIQSITALLSRLEREEDRILSETKKKS